MSTPPQESQSSINTGGGGFFSTGSAEANAAFSAYGLPSPSASSATAASSITNGSILPTPRRRPLKPGGAKESTLINYLDAKIRAVQRRFGLRTVGVKSDNSAATEVTVQDSNHGIFDTDHDEEQDRKRGATSKNSNAASVLEGKGKTVENETVTVTQGQQRDDGYTSFVQAASDISRLISIVWVSGTPSLQVYYLLSLALLVTTYIPEFPVAPKAMFSVLRKLDYSFASLAKGHDFDSGEVLPGFWGSSGDENGRGIPSLSETAKVRIRSLVERTRVVVVDAMNQSDEFEPADEDLERTELDQMEMTGDEADDFDLDDGPEMGNDWDMEVARVYDRTLVELGTTLGGDSNDVGVMTD